MTFWRKRYCRNQKQVEKTKIQMRKIEERKGNDHSKPEENIKHKVYILTHGTPLESGQSELRLLNKQCIDATPEM